MSECHCRPMYFESEGEPSGFGSFVTIKSSGYCGWRSRGSASGGASSPNRRAEFAWVAPVELAESAAEFDVLLAREFLIAEQQNAVIEKRPIDFAELVLAHAARNVDVAYLRAER